MSTSDQTVAMLGDLEMKREGDVLLTDHFARNRDEMSAGQTRDGDLMLVSYPKSGSSWVKRILSLIKTDCDVEKTDASIVDEHVHFVDMYGFPKERRGDEPLFMSTHYLYQFLPETLKRGKGKIIYLARNPKDVTVSYYHYLRSVTRISLKIPFHEYFEQFISGPMLCGLWINHIESYWQHQDDDNFLFLTYEDLHQNLEECILKIATFIGKELTKEQVEIVSLHSKFDQVKDNPSVNHEWWQSRGLLDLKVSPFMRSGKIGDWQNMLTDEMNRRMDDVTAKHLVPLGLSFRYE